jgi:hypothetical protein
LLALGDWGARVPLPPPPATLSATSVMLFLRSSARPDPQAPPTTCRLELDSRVWTVRAEAGRLEVQPGEPADPDAFLRTDPATLNALLGATRDLDTAVLDGSAVAGGDRSALRQLVQAVTAPAAR